MLLPEHVLNVTSPDVAGVQAAAIATPCDPAILVVLDPLRVIGPVVLLITPAALPATLMPKEAAPLPDADPVSRIGPFPVVVEMVLAPPVMLIP